MRKKIAILGSTGSIGTQTLEIIDQHPDLLTVEVLSAHRNDELLVQQAIKYQPNAVVITDESRYEKVKTALANTSIKVFTGYQALNEIVQWDSVDLVVAAITGFAGLHSTIAAIEAKKVVALANKESLVVAGEIVMQKAKENGVFILPIDSEHSAIFQCLVGEDINTVDKITLTASGGPFLGKKPNFLVNVKKDHALQHPNWSMGAKITIDSASLMNKGLEMIEAKWLFGLNNEQIEVIVHPQSIIHSFVSFNDGSVKAQLGMPDMRVPIQYALLFPQRKSNSFPKYNFLSHTKLTFESPDLKTFKNLQLATDAMHLGGNAPCVLNAANEIVVYGFIENKLGFMEMPEIIEEVMNKIAFIEHPTLKELEESDKEARKYTEELMKKSSLYN